MSLADRTLDSSTQAQGALAWLGGARLIVLATALRLLVGLGLFVIACQMAPEAPYDWLSRTLKGPDAIAYQQQALNILDFWQGGEENLAAVLSRKYLGYPAVLAAAYWLTWPHPLAGVVINALCFLVVGLLARKLALMLGNSPRASDGLALLVALWPPSLTYSSILLKDSLVLMGVFVFLVFAVQAIQTAWRKPALAAGIFWPVLAMASGSLVLMNLREDFQPICLAVGLVVALLGCLGSWRKPRRGGLWASLAVVLALFGAMYLSSHFSVAQLTMRSAPNLDGKQSSQSQPGVAVWPGNGQPRGDGLAIAYAGGAMAGQTMPVWLKDPYQVFSRAKLRLIKLRWEYATTGGVSLSPDAQIIPFGSAPRGAIAETSLYTLLLFPYPWERWPMGRSFSWMGFMVSLQSIFWYLLLPGLALGVILGARKNFLASGAILAWFVMVGAVLAFVDLNLGTLYRHRDMVVLPLLPFLCTGLYAWLWRRRSPGQAREPGQLGGG
jgi:hypothetical protein